MSAEASAIEANSDALVLQLEVETDTGGTAMIARALGPDGSELPPTAMVLDGGAWRGQMRIPVRSDIRIVFELSRAGAPPALSRPASVIELGVDPAVFSLNRPVTTTEPVSEPQNRWGWLGLAAAAAALALGLAWWGLGRTAETDDEAAT